MSHIFANNTLSVEAGPGRLFAPQRRSVGRNGWSALDLVIGRVLLDLLGHRLEFIEGVEGALAAACPALLPQRRIRVVVERVRVGEDGPAGAARKKSVRSVAYRKYIFSRKIMNILELRAR